MREHFLKAHMRWESIRVPRICHLIRHRRRRPPASRRARGPLRRASTGKGVDATGHWPRHVFGMFINFGEGEYRLEATYKHFHLWRKAKQRQAQAILNM
ncbi:hypothetical protein PAHAL_8G074400 [Panicum hallii]|uniref:Uncharacterized protein n=1 Tax=Panicum hallii TaxID=206008 RepID=A0A2T8I863_9POAL|nr:hypothetical protein PAHAL_8G074400 [Panicum hallii]